MDAINEARLRVWAQQPDAFFEQPIIEDLAVRIGDISWLFHCQPKVEMSGSPQSRNVG